MIGSIPLQIDKITVHAINANFKRYGYQTTVFSIGTVNTLF
ncbi:hypothetical protein Niako_0898 [Niastella koreensis GR20-10]|uniref:Uncharacterized protein n=1 Tax=Niastella koreensis (strain DSM 17620 / KACC 11465 / NBRC 106392 / GR20-10) TaxID=700598 RepID=G8TE86_NIAKG|nr:hypothetical protein Niako_0898 [Niastella koreensis GR20-10]